MVDHYVQTRQEVQCCLDTLKESLQALDVDLERYARAAPTRASEGTAGTAQALASNSPHSPHSPRSGPGLQGTADEASMRRRFPLTQRPASFASDTAEDERFELRATMQSRAEVIWAVKGLQKSAERDNILVMFEDDYLDESTMDSEDLATARWQPPSTRVRMNALEDELHAHYTQQYMEALTHLNVRTVELEDAQAHIVALTAAVEAATAKGEAQAALVEAEQAEDVVKAAEAELQAAVEEIEGLEKAKTDKIAKCQAIIDDASVGNVKKTRAVQEKEQTLYEDPLPLRKAKITQGAALKKVTKARKLAEEKTANANANAAAATAAKKAAALQEQELQQRQGPVQSTEETSPASTRPPSLIPS